MRRIPAATTILFVFATGCSRATTSSAPTPVSTVVSTSRSPNAETNQKPSTCAVSAVPAPTSTETLQTTSTFATFDLPLAERVAKELVDALIAGHGGPEVTNIDLWEQTLADGQIIQTTTLNAAADRASVAVSVAFETPPGGEPTEPIGVLIELHTGPSGWTVDGIGYL